MSPEKEMEPDRTLGHNRIHCFGLQAWLLKILDSNISIGGFLRHPSEKIFTRRKLVHGTYVKILGEYFRVPVPPLHSKVLMDTNTH